MSHVAQQRQDMAFITLTLIVRHGQLVIGLHLFMGLENQKRQYIASLNHFTPLNMAYMEKLINNNRFRPTINCVLI